MPGASRRRSWRRAPDQSVRPCSSFQPSKDRSPDIRLPRARRRQGLSSCRARVLGLGDTPSSRCRRLGRAEISRPGSALRGIESEISTGVTPAASKHPEQPIHPGYWIINHRGPTIPLFDDKPCILIAYYAVLNKAPMSNTTWEDNPLKAKSLAPSNSIIFVSDVEGWVSPEPVGDAPVQATDTCLFIMCYPEVDGPTKIILAELGELRPTTRPDFTCAIATPRRTVVVSLVEGDVVLKTAVSSTTTTIHVWRSHPKWPEEVVIGWS